MTIKLAAVVGLKYTIILCVLLIMGISSVAGKDAIITSTNLPTGNTYCTNQFSSYTCNNVVMKYTIQNTAGKARQFYMGCSVKQHDSNQWIDIPYVTTPRLNNGQQYTGTFTFNTVNKPFGMYDVALAVWDGASGGYLNNEQDRRMPTNVFAIITCSGCK